MKELQQMRDEAEAAGVDVLMGYNKVRVCKRQKDDENRREINYFPLVTLDGNFASSFLLTNAMITLSERMQVCSQDA